jgi:hypothetical protein
LVSAQSERVAPYEELAARFSGDPVKRVPGAEAENPEYDLA